MYTYFMEISLVWLKIPHHQTPIMKKLLISTIIMLYAALLHAQPDIIGLDPASKNHSSESASPQKISIRNDSLLQAARWARMSGLYLECGMHAGAAGFGMGLLGLRYRFNEKWMIGVSMLDYLQMAPNTPSDFRAGSNAFLIFESDNNKPMVQRSDMSLTLGRTMKMSARSWFSIEGGLSWLKGEKLTFSRRIVATVDPLWMLLGISGTSDNYSIENEKVSVAGAVVRTDLNFKVSPSLVISTGTYMNFNSLKTPLSFQLRFLFGPFAHK